MLQRDLCPTANINNITKAEMEAEIKAQEEEINIRNLAINKQDKDHYISNKEPGPDMPAQTA